MIEMVYVNGDSFAFGQGLDQYKVNADNIYKFTDVKHEQTYGGVIQRTLGISNYKNNALPGGSNDRTVRTTMFDLLELKKSYHPSEILVLIAFTEASRTEVFNGMMNSYSPFLANCAPGKSDMVGRKMWEMFYAHATNEQEQTFRYLQNAILLHDFLVKHGFRFLITDSLNPFLGTDVHQHSLFLENISPSNYLTSKSFVDFNTERNFGFSECYHPLKIGHETWAHHLLEFIRDKGIV